MKDPMGAGVIFKLSGTNVKVEPPTGKDPKGMWQFRQSVMVAADGTNNVTVYLDDPASGVDGFVVASNARLAIDYNGPLWITTPGIATILALG